LSEIHLTETQAKEISQYRIPVPGDDSLEYCNKNWMPILDMPYHYVKWTNGTAVVKCNSLTNVTDLIVSKDWKDLGCGDLRGGSQVIPFGDYRMCVVHETFLYNSEAGRKDGTYRHRFVIWDKNWNIVKISPQFSFMEAKIEFCCGMTVYENDFLLTFGYQDNASYLLKVPQDVVRNFIG
jgi:hypothetical protein